MAGRTDILGKARQSAGPIAWRLRLKCAFAIRQFGIGQGHRQFAALRIDGDDVPILQKADRPGVYYGVCYELCGARHGYMPIAVEVVSREDFARWVASRGGHMPGAAPAAAPAQAGQPATVAATEATASTPAPSNVVQAREAPATTNQGATR